MKPKKKGYFAHHTATFLQIEDAIFWEKLISQNGCTHIQIIPQ